jgi:tRNA modification GTPase
MNKTIVALSSACGTGAIAVVRMSGGDAVKIFAKSIKDYSNYDFQHSSIKRFSLVDKNGEIIDDAMAAVFFAPKSFTGENVVEIFCHGGQITVERIIKRLIELGAVSAQKGEFAKRAFLNGKIDLRKAEAINAVISAGDYYSHKNAMALYNGEGREFFDGIKSGLQNVLVDIESEIEFLETDDFEQDFGSREKIKTILSDISQRILIQKEKYSQLKKIKNGIPVVLVGRTNAGKSSLFNRLLDENRAIVSEKAGTTRDVIAETAMFSDVVVRLFDTAGFNESVGEIEKEGIERTKNEIERAFAALWVISPDNLDIESDYKFVKNIPILIAVLNKSDISKNYEQESFLKENKIEYVKVSARQNLGIQNIVSLLISNIEKRFPEKNFNTFLASQRELNIVENMLEVANSIDFSQSIEIIAENIREMLKILNEIYGFMAPDEIMNKVFDSFCIGK